MSENQPEVDPRTLCPKCGGQIYQDMWKIACCINKKCDDFALPSKSSPKTLREEYDRWVGEGYGMAYTFEEYAEIRFAHERMCYIRYMKNNP